MTNTSRLHVELATNGVIPPASASRPRTVVLCFDGTGDQFDNDNSNVVNFFSLLRKDDHTQQLVYYQAGIGTYTVPQVVTPIMSKVSKALDEAVAWNLDAHVMDGYKFLMDNYQSGDKICLFGFSRGAYTARSLAGMIHKVGLLPSGNHQQVPFAYKMYTNTSGKGWKQSAAFKKAFSIDVDVEFVGVWDTVCSVGLVSRRLPFVSSNSAIRYFRHALSLDERRAKFKANLYNRPTEAENKLGVQRGEMPKSGVDKRSSKISMPDVFEDLINKTTKSAQREEQKQAKREMEFSKQEEDSLETDVLEVWFAGCHCDVGGGSVPNSERHSLARIPLRWMIRQCFLTNTGIRFHASLLKTVGMDPTTLYPIVQPRPPVHSFVPTHKRAKTDATLVETEDVGRSLTEEEEDTKDALCSIYDQLSLKKAWWLLEWLPMVQRYQRKDNTWVEKMVINRGRGRVVPKPTEKGFYVHRTVNIRMEAKNLKGGPYTPKARFVAEPEWVE